jgi:hypothetical protein
MGVLKRNLKPAYIGIALAAFVLTGARAGAVVGDISGTATDRAGTIIVFPKVIADGTRDTIIEITNTMNTDRAAHCAYVPGQGFCSLNTDIVCTPPPARVSGCPVVGEVCIPVPWTEVDFDIVLTAQQPTMWRVSTGRLADPSDPLNGNCEEELVPAPPPAPPVLRQTCPGLDPLDIPPAPGQPFRGQLICYETDSSGFPIAGNALKGEAILETLGFAPPQISQYNSINFEGDSDAVGEDIGDLALKLNSNEFNVCPDTIEFTNYAHLGTDQIANETGALCSGGGRCTGGDNPGAVCSLPAGAECLNGGVCVGPCPVRTEITFVPCTQNFELGVPIPTTVQIRAIDELEGSNSTAFDLNCWANLSLEDIAPGIFSVSRSEFYKTRIFTTPARRCLSGDIFFDPNADPRFFCATDADCGAGGVCGPQPGVLAVIEEFHDFDQSLLGNAAAGTAASNGHMIGQRAGICRNNGATCVDNADCAGGLCREGGGACATDGDCTGGTFDRCDICLIDEIVFAELPPPPPPPP